MLLCNTAWSEGHKTTVLGIMAPVTKDFWVDIPLHGLCIIPERTAFTPPMPTSTAMHNAPLCRGRGHESRESRTRMQTTLFYMQTTPNHPPVGPSLSQLVQQGPARKKIQFGVTAQQNWPPRLFLELILEERNRPKRGGSPKSGKGRTSRVNTMGCGSGSRQTNQHLFPRADAGSQQCVC